MLLLLLTKNSRYQRGPPDQIDSVTGIPTSIASWMNFDVTDCVFLSFYWSRPDEHRRDTRLFGGVCVTDSSTSRRATLTIANCVLAIRHRPPQPPVCWFFAETGFSSSVQDGFDNRAEYDVRLDNFEQFEQFRRRGRITKGSTRRVVFLSENSRATVNSTSGRKQRRLFHSFPINA